MCCRHKKAQPDEKKKCPLRALKDKPWVVTGLWFLAGLNLITALKNFIRATEMLEDLVEKNPRDDH